MVFLDLDTRILERVRDLGSRVVEPRLREMAARHPSVGDIRGRGLFWAIELVSDRETKAPIDAAAMARLRSDLIARGLLPFTTDNRIHVVPPCVITPDEARRGLEIIDAALAAFAG